MKLQFDSQQQHQLDAIQAAVDLFDGQPLSRGNYEVNLDALASGMLSECGYGNQLAIDEASILANVQRIQARNGLPAAETLDGMHFSIDMETGTGKTYVYLRTIMELQRKYGFTKFIIVVPSVAIREGVLKNLQLTREHFHALYENQPYDYHVYDSKRISSLRQFAHADKLQIMVINIDAFNKKENNIIHKENDRLSGRKPIEFIQATRPIVIIDEPQNMESAQAKAAINSLEPLCTLRYSATHRNLYNLLYRLDPVKAYDWKLVKRIEVDSVLDDPDFNQPYMRLDSVEAANGKLVAKLLIDVQKSGGPERKLVTISKTGTDLHQLSGEREQYRGYVVDQIDYATRTVTFANGRRIQCGQEYGGRTDELMRAQIRETVKEHLEKELRIQELLPEGRRLKVLSLFFIDKVAHYADEDGKIRRWFLEAYRELREKPRYATLQLPDENLVHNGYFATDARGKAKDTKGNTKADDDAYELIMRDKERLLSRSEPLRFIFSHSALREGWDNPNVFQICTLNETRSELKKRQEIGRGLRLPVDETGNRVFDSSINRLTVIANESYEDFAAGLQREIEEECGVTFSRERLDNKRQRKQLRLVSKWRSNQDFLALWERIKQRTRYRVEYETEALIRQAGEAIRQMPPITAPRIRTQRHSVEVTEHGVVTQMLAAREQRIEPEIARPVAVPDLIGYLQRETELTRRTIADILIQSGRLADALVNPQQFLDQTAREIRAAMTRLMVAGVKYERINGSEYEMLLFEQNEISSYLTRAIDVKHSLYDAVECDSEVEKQFALELDAREDVSFFLKLPRWFKVDTPLGTYNPDWAVVKRESGEEAKLYLVAETKATLKADQLRDSENLKITCGQAHFRALEDVQFKKVSHAEQI
ncbi:DEAD/DEAH box helicase family protein [Brevibacillus fluminis]|uniref:restriction endonuclease n=1 Tax=Brevibacillus fluminis TaxID=511487 RepID=UPI003F8B0460